MKDDRITEPTSVTSNMQNDERTLMKPRHCELI